MFNFIVFAIYTSSYYGNSAQKVKIPLWILHKENARFTNKLFFAVSVRNGSKGELVMLTRRKKQSPIVRMTYLAILTALVMVLHFSGIGIKLPFLSTPVSLTLIPIAICGMLLGPVSGAFLGFVYGLTVYISLGVMGMDMFTNILFVSNPIITFLICTVKTTLAGLLSGVLYNVLKNKNVIAATFAAACIAPVVNTGIFILGCLLITDTIASMEMFKAFFESGKSVVYLIVIVLPGINFIFEFLFNAILSPTIHRIVTVVSKRISK